MSATPTDIAEAVQRGYPTVAQRRSWTPDQWSIYNEEIDAKVQRRNEEYESGNSPERLRELIDQLLERVAALESQR